MTSNEVDIVDGDEPRCASGPDALGRDLKWGCSSKEVFMSFVYMVSRDPLEYDASQIISKRCYDAWISTRRSHPKSPEKSFQRSLTAHIVGSGGRRPFTAEVEAPLLAELRQKRVWPCFEGTSCQIGLFGIRVKGYHERRANDKTAHSSPANIVAKDHGRTTRNSLKVEENFAGNQTTEQQQTTHAWNGIRMPNQVVSPHQLQTYTSSHRFPISKPVPTLNLSNNNGNSSLRPSSPGRRPFDSNIQFPKLRSYDTATSIASDMSLPGLLDALPSDGKKKTRLRSYGSSNRSESQLFANLLNENQFDSNTMQQGIGSVPWNWVLPQPYVEVTNRSGNSSAGTQQQQVMSNHDEQSTQLANDIANQLRRQQSDQATTTQAPSTGQKHQLYTQEDHNMRMSSNATTLGQTLSRQNSSSSAIQKPKEHELIWNAPTAGSPGHRVPMQQPNGEFHMGSTNTENDTASIASQQSLFRTGLLRYDTNASNVSRMSLQRHNSLKSDHGMPNNNRLRKQASSAAYSLDYGSIPFSNNIWDQAIEEEGEGKMSPHSNSTTVTAADGTKQDPTTATLRTHASSSSSSSYLAGVPPSSTAPSG